MWLIACCVISMIRECSTFTVLIIWQCFVENASKKIILMRDASSLIFMKSKKWERCTDLISRWIRSSSRKEKMMLTTVVLHKKLLQIRLWVILNGFWKEGQKCLRNRKSNKLKCLRCKNSRKNYLLKPMLTFQIYLQIQTPCWLWVQPYSKEWTAASYHHNSQVCRLNSKRSYFRLLKSIIFSRQLSTQMVLLITLPGNKHTQQTSII